MKESEIKELSKKLLEELRIMNPQLYPNSTNKGAILLELLEKTLRSKEKLSIEKSLQVKVDKVSFYHRIETDELNSWLTSYKSRGIIGLMDRKEKSKWVAKEDNYDNQEVLNKLLNDSQKLDKNKFPNTLKRVNKLIKHLLEQSNNTDKIKNLSNISDPTIKVWIENYLKEGIKGLTKTENQKLNKVRPSNSRLPLRKRIKR